MKSTRWLYRKKTYRLATIVAGVLIFAVSSIPNLPQPEVQTEITRYRLDYFFHFLIFFIPGFTAAIWLTERNGKMASKKMLILLFVGILFGLVDEVHQLFIPGRRFNPFDFLYNAAGFSAGVLLTYHWVVRHLVIRKNYFPLLRKKLFDQSV